VRARRLGRWLPFGAGLVFALGLGLSGMTRPAKIVGFLDFFGRRGAWDPSLLLVMLGAVGVYFVVSRLGRRRARPLYAAAFAAPPPSKVDLALVAGSALFGVGWGLSGFCPGPALVSFGAGTRAALWFVPALVAGMLLHRRLAQALDARPKRAANDDG